MIDWTASMEQTFEVYEVDPSTWGDVRLIQNVTSCSITRDSSTALLESASIECDEQLGECYLRIYLIAFQNGSKERICLGTFMVQTPSTSFDGKVSKTTLDAYSPLIELKDTMPPIGYTANKKINVMELATSLTAEHLRAPVVKVSAEDLLYSSYTADSNDSWLDYISGLMSYADYSFDLDEKSRILYSKTKKLAAQQPRWTYTDDNASILAADVSIDRDLYGIPNVVEIYYSGANGVLYSRVVNDDANSIISVPSRGREVHYRECNPSFSGEPTQEIVDKYASDLLEQKSTLQYTVNYTHGYCPVRVGDSVRLNYTSAGLNGVIAKVTNQTIDCSTGVQVSETAVYTQKLWEV